MHTVVGPLNRANLYHLHLMMEPDAVSQTEFFKKSPRQWTVFKTAVGLTATHQHLNPLDLAA